MFNLFKKNEFEIISQKIKNKNHKIIETLNNNEFKKFFKLNEKEQKEKLRKIIEELSGLDFSKVFAYNFHFEDLPMFTYNLHIKKNDYLLVVSGEDAFFGLELNKCVDELLLLTRFNFDVTELSDDQYEIYVSFFEDLCFEQCAFGDCSACF
jgi:hypothetical protein